MQDATSEDFDRIIGVNLKGIWLGMKYQIPHMLAHGGGAIVNTASSAGVQAIPNVAIYTASKHGVVGLTKATALEVARSNIRVNAVAPGPVNTGLLHRMVGGEHRCVGHRGAGADGPRLGAGRDRARDSLAVLGCGLVRDGSRARGGRRIDGRLRQLNELRGESHARIRRQEHHAGRDIAGCPSATTRASST